YPAHSALHEITASDPCRSTWPLKWPGASVRGKNFIGVKVANSGDQLLVEQDRFHCAAVFSNNCLELRKTNSEGVRAKAACLQKFTHIFDQLDLANFPLIVEG